jgi:hypothetical protein
MTKQELSQLIKEGKNIQAVSTYSDSTIFIGMVDFEHGINDYMVGYTIDRFGSYNPKPFKRKIYYGMDGRNYIQIDKYKYFLDEFIRTEIAG